MIFSSDSAKLGALLNCAAVGGAVPASGSGGGGGGGGIVSLTASRSGEVAILNGAKTVPNFAIIQ